MVITGSNPVWRFCRRIPGLDHMSVPPAYVVNQSGWQRKETMSDILSSISTRQTEQTVRAKPEQVQNAAGGYVYQTDDDVQDRDSMQA